MGTLTVITGPTLEPVTVDEAKKSLRIDNSEDDSYIGNLIETARLFAEEYTSLHIMTQTVERSYRRFPSTNINLDVWPLQSIDSVKYDDTSSPMTEVTLTVDVDYYADTTTDGGAVETITGWPSVAIKPNPARIRMTAGYSSRDNVPEKIKNGIKAYVNYLYDADSRWEEIAKSLLWPLRRF